VITELLRPTALITGASSGIGAEFARQLADRGHDLILVARRTERLEILAAELQDRHGITAEPLVADLATSEGIDRVAARLTELSTLALLVNNAGFGISGSLARAELQGQLDMLNVHVVAAMRLSHAALPGMITRGSGGIINVASLAAFMAVPGEVNYCATKAYLVTFSQALAAEVRRTGVGVQALCPGFTLTEFHDEPGRPGAGREGFPRFLWGSSQAVVADSLRALDRGQVLCVPGFTNRMILLLARIGLVNRLAPAFLEK
jgi:short-subunit dehydrogenase